METTLTITVEKTEKVKKEIDVQLPYYSKGKYGTFYKVFGTGGLDAIRVEVSQYLYSISISAVVNAFSENEEQITAEEYDMAYDTALGHLTAKNTI